MKKFMKTVKGLMKSKTFWFNIVTGVLVFVNEVAGKLIPTEVATTIVAVGNVILRMITNQPLSEK